MNQSQDTMFTRPGEGYQPGASYDEMWDANGRIRPHWQSFMKAAEAMGMAALEKSRHDARRIFRENGVSYNVHGDPQGHQRTWELDPIPLIISSEDWAVIEEGLLQRAELMNLVLADLYGERKLIRQGLLPAELVFGHPGFIRACDTRPRQDSRLHDFAVDLSRGPDGRMWVLRDYTQAPAGMGYALENRTVMTRILPQFFQEGHISRMSFFFRALRSGLAEWPTRRREQPRIVVLTPGPYSELYFEHAYLASYLGYPLVQGDDLTVRGGNVWLKTLDGLQQVDVIIRRLNDRFCDPLELAEDSVLGVPGLTQAARAGRVVIVNPVGTAALENPGLIPFLPGIARYYLGSELKLPSAATWWCGQERERAHVLDNLSGMVIKPVHRTLQSETVFGAMLSREQLEDLRQRIRAKPHDYVGQEQVSYSTTPCLIHGRIEPRHAAIRTFVTTQGGHYTVMKGGLTRAARERGLSVPSRHFNSVSKDTWVLAARPERHVSLWLQPATEEMEIERSGILASRAAENLYWTGRYAERLEGTARMLRTTIQQINRAEDLSEETRNRHLDILLRTLTSVTETYPGFLGDTPLDHARTERELIAIMVNGRLGGSIPSLLHLLTSSAYLVRDRWSIDNWRVLDGLKNHWHNVQTHPSMPLISAEYELDVLVSSLAAFMGLNMESMTREPGWLMLDAGRRIERALWLIRTIKSMLVYRQDDVVDHLVMETFLALNESLITHRRRYRSYLQLQTVLETMILDETNPRALAYQIEQLRRNLASLPRPRLNQRLSEEEKQALDAATRLRLTDSVELARISSDGVYTGLLDIVCHVEQRLMNVSDSLTQFYFSHAQGARQLSPTRRKGDPV